MALSQRLGKFKEGVRGFADSFAYTGERRALALLPLAAFALLYLLVAANGQPGWGPAFLGLALAYLIAFFALASGWFWGRWFASGLGWSGFMVGVMALAMMGFIPALAIYTGLHGLVVVALLGNKMAAHYELRDGWRERYAMDEFGVARLGKAVTRGASALPTLILWALAPREESLALLGGGTAANLWLFAGLGLLVLGLVGLVHRRGFGLLALAGAGLSVAAGVGLGDLVLAGPFADTLWAAHGPFAPSPTPLVALPLLLAAFAPWAGPVARHLFGRR